MVWSSFIHAIASPPWKSTDVTSRWGGGMGCVCVCVCVCKTVTLQYIGSTHQSSMAQPLVDFHNH